MTSAGGRALLGRQPAVNDQLAAGDKGGLIGSQVQDPIGHVLRVAEPPEGVAGKTTLASLRIRQHPGRHKGLNDPRMDGVTPYAFPGVLYGRRLGQQTHRPLGGAVGGGLSSDYPRDGGDVDNRASPGLAHRWYGVFGAQEYPPGIHLHHPVPLLLSEVLHGDRLAVRATGAADARIVHQHVQRAEAGHGSSNGLLPVLGLDRKSTRLNSSHLVISYAVFCLKKKKKSETTQASKRYHKHKPHQYVNKHPTTSQTGKYVPPQQLSRRLQNQHTVRTVGV